MNTHHESTGGENTSPADLNKTPNAGQAQPGEVGLSPQPNTPSRPLGGRRLLFFDTVRRGESFEDFKARFRAALVRQGLLREDDVDEGEAQQ